MKCYCVCGWPILMAYRPTGETHVPIFFDRSQRIIGQSLARCPHCGQPLDEHTVEHVPPALRALPSHHRRMPGSATA